MIDHSRRKLLITDLDNTLWDWFEAWYQSFSAMLDNLSRSSGVQPSVLEEQIRRIHQARGTAEYSNLVSEVPALVEAAAPGVPSERFDDALHVQNSRRRSATRLYPGVYDALVALKRAGVRVVAYTESVAYWTEWRIRHTALDGVIDVLYSAPDHLMPDGQRPEDLRTGHLPPTSYGLKKTLHQHVGRGVQKPNEQVLRSILREQRTQPSDAVYIGDSLMKDIAMAQATGVLDVYAKYGVVQGKPEYELLRRVTHWSDADVIRERELSHESTQITPTFTCVNNFAEVLEVFGLTPLHSQ